MTQTVAAGRTGACDPAAAITRSLLGFGVIAMPMFVTVSLVEGVTRAGFRFTTHSWSLLANGAWGWIHITTMILAGAMTVAFAVGLRRWLGTGIAAGWGPRLIALHGAGLIAAGVLIADPSMGFPPGTPAGAGPVSWHGVGHLVSATIGFVGLIAGCFVLARRFARDGAAGLARFTRLTGAVFGLGFVGVAAGQGAAWSLLAFTAAVGLTAVWSASTAIHAYRRSHE
jgi:hypothetical protein